MFIKEIETRNEIELNLEDPKRSTALLATTDVQKLSVHSKNRSFENKIYKKYGFLSIVFTKKLNFLTQKVSEVHCQYEKKRVHVELIFYLHKIRDRDQRHFCF